MCERERPVSLTDSPLIEHKLISDIFLLKVFSLCGNTFTILVQAFECSLSVFDDILMD